MWQWQLASFNTLPLRMDQNAHDGEEEPRAEGLAVHEALEAGVGADFVVIRDDYEHSRGDQSKDDVADHSFGVVSLRRSLLASWVDVLTKERLVRIIMRRRYSAERDKAIPFGSISSSVGIEAVSLIPNSLQHVILGCIRMYALKVSQNLGMM